MNTRSLLDQLLKSGQGLLQGQSSGKEGGSNPLGGFLSGAGGGALAAGALGLLLGNKKARKLGGKVATYGGLAALGVVAYKAYSNWQQQQGGAGAVAPAAPRTVDRLPDAEAEQHAQAILQAMVAAAKADGHVDARERQLIEDALGKLSGEALPSWLERELNKPLDPSQVAGAARTPEIAAEMYLASLLIVDQDNFMERTYLEELARQLNIAPSLKQELEVQARQALV